MTDLLTYDILTYNIVTKKKKQAEIDIVGVPMPGEDTYIIGSCKFRNEKIGVAELELMREYSKVFGKGSKYIYYIFSLGGFTNDLMECQQRNEVILVTLEDMYDIGNMKCKVQMK